MGAPEELLADLTAEGDDLDALVAPLPPAAWRTASAAPGWTIAHQVAHLAWTDDISLVAATDPEAFAARLDVALREEGFLDRVAAEGAEDPPAELLARWRAGRTALVGALRAVPDGRRLPWFGPPMGAASMATARIMETWAHGQDVADALGVVRTPTARLRHVAHLGVRTREFAHAVRGLPAPTQPVRVELEGPDGDPWTWGPEHASQRVTGPALDFCLLVTQRRNRADLAVVATGTEAATWLEVAQAFAGPPGPGRPSTGAEPPTPSSVRRSPVEH